MKVMEPFVWSVLGFLAAMVPTSLIVLPTTKRPHTNDTRLPYTAPQIVYEGRTDTRRRA